MVTVLAWLRANRGGVETYLRDAGIAEAQLKRVRLRLLEK
jgi:hypothetical protein